MVIGALTVGWSFLGGASLYAGILIGLDGSTKIRKPSVMSVFSVTDGLKVISPCCSLLARTFFSKCLCVSVRLSFLGEVLGLNLGRRLSSMLFATVTHLCGFLQPRSVSSMQSVHPHDGFWR